MWQREETKRDRKKEEKSERKREEDKKRWKQREDIELKVEKGRKWEKEGIRGMPKTSN